MASLQPFEPTASGKVSNEKKREYSFGHEIANATTHGIGALLSLAGTIALIMAASRQEDIWRIVSVSIYGSSMVILYMASTLYHSLPGPRTRRVFKIIDHSAIYLLIAGTYTPIMLVSIRATGALAWILFGVIWGLACLGILCKALYIDRYEKTAIAAYIGMGWLCLFAIDEIRAAIGATGMTLMVAGGLSYTFGVIFYDWRRIPFYHAIWHLFVLAGSICHYFAVLLFVLPY